jgi:predicted ferric reductase
MNEILQLFNTALALDSGHVFWFITRSAGLMAYLLVWLSTVWGLAVATKVLDRFLPRLFTFDAHEFFSLLGLGFVAVHVGALLFDSSAPFSLPELLIPFISTFRPFWVGVGIIATYLGVLVTVTFYLRRQIGFQVFRAIHLLSFLSYAGATVHGIMAGSDTGLGMTQLVYFETALIVVVLTVYYFWQRRASRRLRGTAQRKTGKRAPVHLVPMRPLAESRVKWKGGSI